MTWCSTCLPTIWAARMWPATRAD